MFGGPRTPPRISKPRPCPKKLHDINMPDQTPEKFGHNARIPNTNYVVKKLHYKQRLREILDKMAQKLRNNIYSDKLFIQYLDHYNKKDLLREVKKRTEDKLKAAEEATEKRRQKLMDMLAEEERQFVYETVDQVQRGKETKLAEMKERAENIKAKREEERLKVVEAKRFLQYRDQNELLRPALVKLHNIESKMVNLQQMRENEAKREAERETDQFYYKIMMKDINEKIKREEQDAVKNGNDMREIVSIWDKQIRGKELLKKQIEAVEAEDREDILRIMKELKTDHQSEYLRIMKEKKERHDDITNQMKLRAKLLAERQKEIDELDKAFAYLNSLELAKEQQSDADLRQKAKKEMATYRKYVADLKHSRFVEEKQIQSVLEAHQKEILRKQDEEKCKIKAAKVKLKKEVFAIRAQQLEEKKLQKARDKEENNKLAEFMQKVIDIDSCLDKEAERLRKEEILQYRDDLCKQIGYNQMIKEREKQEMEREQKLFDIEEEKYLEVIDKMVQEKIEGGSNHPFREVLEEFECFCREHESKM